MFDGIFIHYLVKELKKIENLRINKLGTITASEFYLTLSSKDTLLISINSNSMNVRLSKLNFVNSSQKNNFQVTLKKYLESSIINTISQYENDRIIIFTLTHFDELGYEQNIKLIIECFGRNSNICLINNDNLIIDCYKRCLEGNGIDNRIIMPKAKYTFPISERINPFLEKRDLSLGNVYQGVSNLLFGEIEHLHTLDVIYKKASPVLIKGEKNHFYCFDLTYINGERIYFESLSELLEYFYKEIKNDVFSNNEQIYLKNHINKEIERIKNKINKQKNELEIANDDLKYEKIGNLLLSYIYLCKKGDNKIVVDNFYDNNNRITISLDPLLTPEQNAKHFFKKYQKAKRAITFINNQLNISNNQLNYYECLLNQLQISKINDLMEIYDELQIKSKVTKRPKKAKPNITTYITLNDDYIFVGKNNIQNNYLTNTFAKKTDYFFHVQNVPGSHVILRTENLTDDLIYLTACIASYYSSYSESTNVCVDYTIVKNVKRIPEQEGSFVTYKNHKSVFGKPDINYINKHTKMTKC